MRMPNGNVVAETIYESRLVANALGLSERQLIYLSILTGNDYSSHIDFLPDLLPSRDIATVHEFLRSHPNFTLDSSDPVIQKVVDYCCDFYELNVIDRYETSVDSEERESESAVEDPRNCACLSAAQIDTISALDLHHEYDLNSSTNISIVAASIAIDILAKYRNFRFPSVHDIYINALTLMLEILMDDTTVAGRNREVLHSLPTWKDIQASQIFQLICKTLIQTDDVFASCCPLSMFNAAIFHECVACLRVESESISASTSAESTKTNSQRHMTLKLPIDNNGPEILKLISRDRVSLIHG